MAEQQATATDATPAGGSGGGGSAGLLVPALLALMRVVRGVPVEVLSQQQQQRDTAVSAVVQALRSDYQPLQAEALETFQVRPAEKTSASFFFFFLLHGWWVSGTVFTRMSSCKAWDNGILLLFLSCRCTKSVLYVGVCCRCRSSHSNGIPFRVSFPSVDRGTCGGPGLKTHSYFFFFF